MSAQTDETDIADLLPDDLAPKGKAAPLVRTPAVRAKQTAAQKKAQEQATLQAQAVRLAQIVNLHIGGYSITQIAASIGATPEEVERLLAQDMARYVRTQPALRTYVRNWVSERYMKMIEVNWTEASDPNAKGRLENQDRVVRILDRMAKLHGAEAPVQSEVKVDAAPEAVERLVQALAAGQGLDYDADIFDVDETDIHEAVVVSGNAVMESSAAVEQPQEGEPDEGF